MSEVPVEQQFPRSQGMTYIDLLNYLIALDWQQSGMSTPTAEDVG